MPFMVSNALQVLYSVVDMIVVGNVLGSVGLSAVSTASHVVTFMTMVALGFSTGGQVYISQLIGSGRKEQLNRAIGTLFTMILLFGLLMTVLGTSLARPLMRLLKTPAESFDMAASYLLICSAGVIFTCGYNLLSAILRGMGNSLLPCVFIVVATIINVVLDIVFVVVLGWGVKGAAYATIIGQGVSFISALIYLFLHREQFGFDFRPKSFIPDKASCKSYIVLGVPLALRSAAVNVSMMFVTALVNNVSVHASAVFGVGLKVDDVVSKITMGVNYAVSTTVGQNFAAKKFDRTKKAVYFGWTFCFVMYLIFTLIYVFNIQGLFGLFTKDAEVLGLAPVFVKAIVWSFPAIVIMRGTNGFIQGIGNTTLSFIFAILDGFVLRIGLSYLLGVTAGLGLYGLFLGYGIATYGTAIPGMIYFFVGRWKNRTLKYLPDEKAE